MEVDYLVPLEQRTSQYYNCGNGGNGGNGGTGGNGDLRDQYAPTEHIYEELKEPPLPLPERNYKTHLTNGSSPAGQVTCTDVKDGNDTRVAGGKKRINSTYQSTEELEGAAYPCCRHRKCFITIILIFILSGVSTAGLLYHLYPEEPAELAFSVFWPEVSGDASPAMDKVFFNKSYVIYPPASLPLSSSVLTTPSQGVYLFSLSLFAGSDICSYRIENPVIPIILGRSSGNRIDGDTIGREMILELPGQTEMHILKSGFIHDKDNYFLNSWSGFSISGAMERNIVFSAARDTLWNAMGDVLFPVVLTNKGGGYDVTSGLFTAPVSGVYYFSASVGTEGSETIQATISVNGVPVADIFRNSSTHDGPEILSRVVMLTLEEGDTASLSLVQGHLYSSGVIRETSFMGFLYQPKFGDKHVWSFQSHRSYIGLGQFHLDPVPFTRELVSVGVITDNKVIVTINCSGIYYIHINAGVLPQKKLLLRLQVNDRTVASIWRYSSVYNRTGHDGYDTVGRSVVLGLEAGDRVWLSAAGYKQFGLGSTPYTLTSFTGFMIHKDTTNSIR